MKYFITMGGLTCWQNFKPSFTP